MIVILTDKNESTIKKQEDKEKYYKNSGIKFKEKS